VRLESPWQPDGAYLAALPQPFQLLLSAYGRYHLMLDDDGQWWHLHADGGRTAVDAGRAAQLRPGECDLVMKLTMVWAWRVGSDEKRATTAIDVLAHGIKRMVVSYARAARQRPVDGPA